MNIASLRIVTRDVPGLASFYQHLTGAEPATQNDDFVEVACGAMTLAICSERSVERFNAGAASGAANRSVIIEFKVDAVDVVRERVADLVSEWVQEPTDQPWGNRSMLLRDPDGNLINIFSPIAKGSS